MLAWCDFQMQVMLKTWPPLWLLIPLPSSWIQPPTLDVESAGRVLVFSSPFPSFFFFPSFLPLLLPPLVLTPFSEEKLPSMDAEFILLPLLVFRRLLFTNESLLPHELGQGQAAFGRHKHSKPVEDSSTSRSVKDFSRGVGEGEGVELRSGEGEGVEPRNSGEGEGVELRGGEGEGMEPRNSGEGEGVELRGAGKGEESYVEPSLKNLSQENSDLSSSVANEHISSEHSNQVTAAERTMKGGSPTSPPPLTLDELTRVRAQVASLATHSSPLTPHTCSSYFIEPVEWMEPTLLGHVEGKVRVCCCELTICCIIM